jgi:hypothetical protein
MARHFELVLVASIASRFPKRHRWKGNQLSLQPPHFQAFASEAGTTRTIRDVVGMGRKADVTQTSSTPRAHSDKPSFARTISCG